MNHRFAVSWGDSKKAVAGLAVLILSCALISVPLPPNMPVGDGDFVSVVVRRLPGSGTAADQKVVDLGGSKSHALDIIDGFSAHVPRSTIDELRESPGVLAVTHNKRVRLEGDSAGQLNSHAGSMYNVARAIGADQLWKKDIGGKGVDIAIIDSGIVPVEGLTTSEKVVNGADLSFESQDPELRYLDTFGHGTHMAGIMAGADSDVRVGGDADPSDWRFGGIAPEARIVNVKVADAIGATDVSQVIAGIEWVVQHKNDRGLNIKVLNLSFGTDGTQDPTLDPLSYAAQVAWDAGITVVVAAGNQGYGSPKLNNPALNPNLIAVGAADTNGTPDSSDDSVPEFSSRGDEARHPDVVAPGKSVVSLRDPGSFIDTTFPDAVVGNRFFLGSGTSQAAAVVSGSVALLLQQRPQLSPGQVKALLAETAVPIAGADQGQGAGLIDLAAAAAAPVPAEGPAPEPDGSGEEPPTAAQPPQPDAEPTPPPDRTDSPAGPTQPAGEELAPEPSPTAAPEPTPEPEVEAPGTGSLEAARGTGHLLSPEGNELRGEQDIFGTPWNGVVWAEAARTHSSWQGGHWNGVPWTGGAWNDDGRKWLLMSWESIEWTRNSWSGGGWSRNSWSRNSWSGASWTGEAWSRNSWSGDTWARNSWSSSSWR